MADRSHQSSETREIRLELGFAAYKTDTVRLVANNLHGYTHIVASRQGLYAVNAHEWLLVANGFFFGITIRGTDIFAFECCDQPRGPLRMGRIVKLTVQDNQIVNAKVLAKGLDNGCHQIDFIDDRLVVTDTYNQRLLRFAEDFTNHEMICPLPTSPTGWLGGDLAYLHVNSLLAVGDKRLLLLHNMGTVTGRKSEIAVCDRDWNIQQKWQVDGTGCHGLALLQDGTVLTTGSMEGRVVGTDGFATVVSPFMTRGLAVGTESIVVGASRWSKRDGRMNTSGTVTFMDPTYAVEGVLIMPAAPTELRRLDGQDTGISSYLAGVAWGSTIKPGRPV